MHKVLKEINIQKKKMKIIINYAQLYELET